MIIEVDIFELNIDGLVGPSHHYAGLSPGNLASSHNAYRTANPKAAALQGLRKMRLLLELGLHQAVMPPQERPNLTLLRDCGFTGTDTQLLQKAHQQAPALLSACYSASCMWTANAATITPSRDSGDQKVHFTPANLVSNLHRHQEAAFTALALKKIFSDAEHFVHHPVLPHASVMGDEGAANHSRLCHTHAEAGLHLYVYGHSGSHHHQTPLPQRYPARQTRQASECIARSHGLTDRQTVFACQNPQAIDAGVFHNDVIAVANESLLLVHEDAFWQQSSVLAELQQKMDFELQIFQVARDALSVEEAVASYLFNSQLVSLSDGSMVMIAPAECEENQRARRLIEDIVQDSDNALTKVHFMDLKQSMRNGGGPACLRLRVPLSRMQLQQMHQGVLLDSHRLAQLERWVEEHYRDRLVVDDLVDPVFIQENQFALDALTKLLDLGNFYPFQQ